MGVRVRTDILKRVTNTAPQKGLNNVEREKNLRKAFSTFDNIKDLPETVLIVDDIYTTGSTIEACTKVYGKRNKKGVLYQCGYRSQQINHK